MDWYTNKQHQSYFGSKVWVHMNKAWKIMARSVQSSPLLIDGVDHSNLWWLVGLKLIGNGFTYAKAHETYCKGIQ